MRPIDAPMDAYGTGMADINLLTVAQAEALEHILEDLRTHGFDPNGAGIAGPNVHVEMHRDGIDWWIDSDEGFADGTMDAHGAGLWWLRRVQAGSVLHVEEARDGVR